MADGGPGTTVGASAHPEEDGQRQQDHPQIVDGLVGPHNPKEHLGEHPDDNGHGESPGDAHAEPGGLHFQLFLVHFLVVLGRRLGDFQHFIPGVGHRLLELSQTGDARHKGNGRLFRGQVDGGAGHPFNLLQGSFHVTYTTGAGHAADGQGDGLGRDLIACVTHSGHQVGCPGSVRRQLHRRPLGGQVDAGAGHPFNIL